ncbi:AraC family transcriptional regulator [Arenibacter sp. N53]|nr:AraC family transcriptional regulator [Arenibacter sp. N53]
MFGTSKSLNYRQPNQIEFRGSCLISGLLFFLVLIYFPTQNCFAQEPTSMKEIKILNLTYNEIMELEDEAYENNELDRLRILTDIHIRKAKKEDNLLEIASGYYYRTIIEEPELAVTYSDSIILATADSDDSKYPTFGYILKAINLYDLGDYRQAMHNYLAAYNLAVQKKNYEDQLTCSMAIAAIRNINGQPHAAADIYTRSLNSLKKKRDYEDSHYDDYMLLMYNLSLAHLRLSQLDSARYYIESGVRKAISVNDTLEYRDFVLVGAQLDYYEGNFQKAKDTLIKYTNQLEGNSKAMKLYYLGKMAQNSGDHPIAITYFQQIDSIVEVTKKPFDEIKDVYQQLIRHYGLQDDQQREIESIEKLIFFDSLMTKDHKGVLMQATMAYDIPYLKLQKKKAEEQLKVKSTWNIILGALAGFVALIGIYFYIRVRKTKKKVKELMDGIKPIKSSSRKVGTHPESVPVEIRNELLMKLEAFENSDLYLRKNLDMAQLAQEMDTNTSYLSIIINHYKQMSFPNYIKDLKITTAIERLSKDPELLKYNYQGLAETFGFKTGESFSKAFHQKTGVYPSNLLKELKIRKNTQQ